MPIQDIALKTSWVQWMIETGCERGSGRFVLAAEQDDDDDDDDDDKVKIDETQQNSKCWLCGDSDETIYYIITECSKLAQKEYKTEYDWVTKVIRWELCKKLKFDDTNKWCIRIKFCGILRYKQIP